MRATARRRRRCVRSSRSSADAAASTSRPTVPQIFDDARARLEAIQPVVRTDVDRRAPVMRASSPITTASAAVAQADFVVDRIVRRRDLHGAGSELAIDRLVRDDRNPAFEQRRYHRRCRSSPRSARRRVDGDRDVGEHRLGSRRRDRRSIAAVDRRTDSAHAKACRRARRLRPPHRRWSTCAVGIPVDQARSAIDQSLAIESHEDLARPPPTNPHPS